MKVATRRLVPALLGAVAFLPGGILAAPAAGRGSDVLMRFRPGFDVRKVPARDARVALTPAGRLSVCTGTRNQWPGITLKAPGGKWDLDSRRYVEADVRNPGRTAVTVNCRVDNPGADGKRNCRNGSLRLEPGATGVLRVALSPTPWRLSRDVEFMGMRGAPGGPGTLDPTRVNQILLFVKQPSAERIFEVGEIRAGGRLTDLKAESFFPFIDELGQFIHDDWPGKMHSLQELKESIRIEDRDLEAHPGPPDRDRFGGWEAGPKLEATGFFRVEKRDGKWWLVDPEGRLFWSHGVDCVRSGNATPISDRENYFQGLPAAGSPLAAFYGRGSYAAHGYYSEHAPFRTFDFGRANRFSKYGSSYEKISWQRSHRRLRSWGMNTIANWSQREYWLLRKTPYVGTVNFRSRRLEGSEGYWGKFPDVFDPSFRENLRRHLAWEKGGALGDPWCIGIFVHNELGWGSDVSLALAALQSPPDQAAKKAFLGDLRAKYGTIGKLNAAWGSRYAGWDALRESQKPPDEQKARADLEAFYTRTAETYFRTIREELKKVAPHQLYLGCRFAWVNDRAARAAAKYCDVVSYNRYAYSVEDLRLPGDIDKPLIIGEFHFGALDRGMFHTGLRPTTDQNDRAAKYRKYVEGALRNPAVVGTHWFQYQSQPTTGRSDGENYQIGLVDICDNPYPEIIEACRDVGYRMYRLRSGTR